MVSPTSLTGLTASQALFEHADLGAGQKILVNGAGGGVGGVAIQFAKEAGATVIATASSRSADAVRAHGADRITHDTRVNNKKPVGSVRPGVMLVAFMGFSMVGRQGFEP